MRGLASEVRFSVSGCAGRAKKVEALELAGDSTSGGRCYTICITIRFEWDEHKNRINQAKHDGIDFLTAALVFNDPYLMLRKDRVVDGEQRWHAVGAIEAAVLLVVHVYREKGQHGEEEIIRIISARAANNRERRIYIQQAAQ